jgi:hypothetical protein
MFDFYIANDDRPEDRQRFMQRNKDMLFTISLAGEMSMTWQQSSGGINARYGITRPAGHHNTPK